MRAIGVIDYGMGNLHSLGKALERVCSATRVEVSYDPEVLMKCDRIVLPGVGGVKACMNELRRLELNEMVREAARTKPLMGICLGMQVMLDHSEENGGVDALGIISGQVRRFPDPPPADPADGPAFFVMSLVGVIGMMALMAFDFMAHPPIWVHLVVTLPLLTLMCLATLRPFKGWMVSEQYVHKAAPPVWESIGKHGSGAGPRGRRPD